MRNPNKFNTLLEDLRDLRKMNKFLISELKFARRRMKRYVDRYWDLKNLFNEKKK